MTHKINDIVKTKSNGSGKIIHIEKYNRLSGDNMYRYGIELENNTYGYSPVYFYSREII